MNKPETSIAQDVVSAGLVTHRAAAEQVGAEADAGRGAGDDGLAHGGSVPVDQRKRGVVYHQGVS